MVVEAPLYGISRGGRPKDDISQLSEKQPDPLLTTAPDFVTQETTAIPEHIKLYAERAANVDYYSRRFLLTRDLAAQYGAYLHGKGISPSEIEDKMTYACQFLTDVQEDTLNQHDCSLFGDEEQMLLDMYKSASCKLKAETQDNQDKYTSVFKRIKANNTFIQNFLSYSQEQREVILQSMGFTQEEMQEIIINVSKAAASTVVVNTIDGPVLDAVGLFLGKIVGDDFADYVKEAGPSVKWMVRSGALASAAAFYGSRIAKTIHTERAIRKGVYFVPNVFVAITAMANEKMISPEEKTYWTRLSTIAAEFISPQSIIDEKWLATLLLGDNGITYMAGNVPATLSNVAQIGIVEAIIQRKKYLERQTREEAERYTFNLDTLYNDPVLQLR